MKRIALIADVHGNYTAFSKAIETIKNLNVDKIYLAGDIIGIGPSSKECLDLAFSLNTPYIVRGNHENYLLHGFHNPKACFEKAHHEFIKSQLNHDYEEEIKKWPYVIYDKVEGVKIALMHYARRNDHFELIVHNPKSELLDDSYKDIDCDVIVYGHEHLSSIIKGKKLYVDIGSLGCNSFNKGYLRFMIMTIRDRKIQLDEYLINYDISNEIEKIKRLKYPEYENVMEYFLKS